jgi:hypothetical protein
LLDELSSAELTLLATFSTAYLGGFAGSDGFSYLPFIVSELKSTFDPLTANVVGVGCTGTVINSILGRMDKRSQQRRSSV